MKRPLTDDQRRTICRLAFAVLCVLPTAIVWYHIVHPPTPSQWAQVIEARLGLQVTIERVERPEPHAVILRGVTWFRSDRLPLVRLGSIRVERRATSRIVIDEPVNLSASDLGQFLQRASEYSLRAGTPPQTWRVEIRQLTVDHGPPGAVRDHRTLSPVELQIRSDESQMLALVRARVLGQAPAMAPMELLLARRLDGTAWVETIDCSTGSTPLPLWMAAALIPETQRLGDQCQFVGQLNLTRAQRGWDGQLVGEFTQIDLDHWAASCGLAAGGTGRGVVRHCAFQSNQVVGLDLVLTGQFGWLGPSTWRGLSRLLSDPAGVPINDAVSFSTASAKVRYLRGWIELSDVEVRDRLNTPLLGERLGYCQVALESFAKTLWSGESPQAPITDATVDFLHRFQLPPFERHAERETIQR